MIESKQTKDLTNLVNYVYALGYGDGINQLSTSVYAASTQSSFLNANIESTDTTITVVDGSVFDATGTARIAEEQLTYSGTTATTLTGVTRGANSTTAKAHNKNCYIEQHFTTTSAQTGSSIQVYGLMDHTLIDRTIIDEETLEVVASGYLSDRKTPILRVVVTPDEPITDAALNIGDNVTVTDSEADIDSSYRIVGQKYRSDYGNLTLETELSNRSLEFIEQMQKSKQDAEEMSKYMQGATNIYAIHSSENCDENDYMRVRFFIPNEAVAINKVLTNFKVLPARNSNVITDYDSTTFSVNNVSSGYSYLGDITVTASANQKVFVIYSLGADADSPDETIDINFYKNGVGDTYMYADAGCFSNDNDNEISVTLSRQTIYDITSSGNYTFTLSGSSDDSTGDVKNGQLQAIVFSTGLWSDVDPTSTSVNVRVYNDSETVDWTSSAYTSSSQEEVDITETIQDIGTGSWANVEFQPNKLMRIEASTYAQIFLESK
jgi:hypothetical protein